MLSETYPKIKIKADDNVKFSVIDKVKEYAKEKEYKYIELDGCKIIFDDGFALVRASNTGPNITTRYEAKTKERLIEIQDEIEKLLDKLLK